MKNLCLSLVLFTLLGGKSFGQDPRSTYLLFNETKDTLFVYARTLEKAEYDEDEYFEQKEWKINYVQTSAPFSGTQVLSGFTLTGLVIYRKNAEGKMEVATDLVATRRANGVAINYNR